MNTKNEVLSLEGWDMDYIRFGQGSRTLIILPGLGDGLRTVRGTALPMAMTYRLFAQDFTVYFFSRRNQLPQGFTTRDMARDAVAAMDALGIGQADVFGVSMGGMIAQYMAIDHPHRVGKLVLAVTCGGPNPILEQSVSLWMDQARQGDHTALMDSNLRLIYSDAYYRKNRRLIPMVARLTQPENYERFLILARACLTHDAMAELSGIRCPTFVIGGEQDLALGAESSRQLAAAIGGARLKMYPQWGHGLYEEEKTFNRTVLDFLK